SPSRSSSTPSCSALAKQASGCWPKPVRSSSGSRRLPGSSASTRPARASLGSARKPTRSKMDCDVAVLGGGPGGYTAAIRAAQLGARTVCIEQEAELGGTCLRVGCIPTKAWVQTAFFLKAAEESFGKLGVRVGEPQLDFGASNEWKAQVVKQMTQGVAGLFKA